MKEMFKRRKKEKTLPENRLWKKLNRFARTAGAKLVYATLLMYYAFRRKDTPAWAKTAILGAITYFLSPIDFIPDLTPLLGFTDDFAVMLTGLITVGTYVDNKVRSQARLKMDQWFGTDDVTDAIEEVERKMIKQKKT